MTIEEYFGDWSQIIDLNRVNRLVKSLKEMPDICPLHKDIFKAFHLCPLKNLRVLLLAMDPYNNKINGKPVATGLAFANASDTPERLISPSLDILRESVIDFKRPHGTINFDKSLEKWEEQGVLLLNSALTCKVNQPGSHTLLWRPFIRDLLTNLSKHTTGIVYVLLGSDAKSFESYINKSFNHVLTEKHPAWYARDKTSMPSDIWRDINKILIGQNGYGIKWYQEVKQLNTEKGEEVFYEGN